MSASAGHPSARTEAPLGRGSVGGPAPAGLGTTAATASGRLVSARTGLGCSAPEPAAGPLAPGPRRPARPATPPSSLAAPPPRRLGRPGGGGRQGKGRSGEQLRPPAGSAPGAWGRWARGAHPLPRGAALRGLRAAAEPMLTDTRGGKGCWRILCLFTRLPWCARGRPRT